MQRPIEKFNWNKHITSENWEEYYRGTDRLSCSEYITFGDNGDIIDCSYDGYITIEELQAIYETAKEIKEAYNENNNMR